MAEQAETARWWKAALIAGVLIELIGAASAWLSNSGYSNGWFNSLQKPPFMPPGWAFALVWPILYALMGISLAMVLSVARSPRREAALTLFFIQLALNFAWSPIFFAWHDIRVAKIVIFVLTGVAAAAAGQFLRLRKAAGLLLLPYLAWLIFATILNATIEDLNPLAGHSLFSRVAR